MENLKFMAKGQKLIRLEIKPIYSGVRNYMEAEFILNHSWYNIIPLVAQFKKDEKIFHITLNNGKCTVPWEVLENAGTIEISLTGGDLLVTNTVKVTVNNSGAEGGLVPTEASNSLYSEIMIKLNSVEEDWLNCKSLMAEYEQNISDSETAVDNKITDFEAKSDELSRKISEINELAEKCKNDSKTAQSIYGDVKEKFDNAKETIDIIVEKIALAENTKSGLEESISKGENTKAVLDSTITSAENIKTQLKLDDCIAENERAEKNIEQLESDNFNAEEILYGVEDLKEYTGYNENGSCFFAKFDTTTGTITECLDRNVKKIDFSKGYNGMKVNAIGRYAFAGCDNLTEIELGADINSIGENAFMGSGLTDDVVIPPNIMKIGEDAFKYTNAKIYNLSDVEITDNVHCDEGSLVQSDAEGNLTSSAKFRIVGKYFTAIGSGKLSNIKVSLYSDYLEQIEEAYVQKGITTIGTEMFMDCTALKKVELPEGITDINYRAFRGCTALTEIKIPKSITNIGTVAFGYCNSLKEVAIPEGISVIKNDLFASCKGLKKVHIPETVKSIEASAFYGCELLTDINIPKNIQSIGANAFLGCAIESIEIGNKIETISETAFKSCRKLKTITLSKEQGGVEGAPWGAEDAEIIWEE